MHVVLGWPKQSSVPNPEAGARKLRFTSSMTSEPQVVVVYMMALWSLGLCVYTHSLCTSTLQNALDQAQTRAECERDQR